MADLRNAVSGTALPAGTRIVMSGGTGFLGSSLQQALSGQGVKLVVLTRGETRRRAPEGVTFVKWKGTPSADLAGVIEGVDIVFNLAGESIGGGRWTARRKQRILKSRVDPTTALVQAMAGTKKPPRVFVSVSGIGVYGNTGSEPVVESHPAGDDFLARVCVEWEAAALQAEALGVRVLLPRNGLVLGTGGGALTRMSIPYRFFAGGPLGSGDQWFPWIHAGDLVRAYLHLVQHPSLRGPVNVVAPEMVTMQTLAQTLGLVLHRPSWFRVPAFVLRALLGEMADLVLYGQRAVPAVLEQSGFSFTFSSLAPALRDIFGRPE